jgi:ribosomal protein L11 methyltransferase
MAWLQLELEAAPGRAEQLSELLQAAGAGAVTLQDAADQPLFEPPPGTTPLWSSTRVVGLFEADFDIPQVLTYLQQQLEPEPLPRWHLNPLEDRDWVRAWMDNFQPMRFGEQLWICPTGFTPPEPQAINILLDPGLAFGTGTHPTTAMCLRWLDAHPPQDLEVIDFGCGSGILAIAACKLGARHVSGVDTDPQAILATHDNAEKNQVSDRIDAYLPADFHAQPVPLLLANILAGPLKSLAPRFSELVEPAGHIVLSGILAEQVEAVMQPYRASFEIQVVEQQEEWVCLAGQRY